MKIHALGTGDAFNGAGRGHTCFALEDADGVALVDAGGQVLAALQNAGIAPERIDAVHLTHLHGDHIGGWPFLLVDAQHREKRTRALEVTGPPGTRERLAALWAACYADAAKKPLGFPLEVTELSPGEERVICGRRIEALRAQHMRPPHIALSLRISAPRTVAFTGDTGPHAGLPSLWAGASLVVGECTDLVALHEERRHLAWDDWKALLPEMRGVPVRLAHLSTEARAGAGRIEDEGRLLGDVRVLDDGDVIEVM